MRNGRGDAEHFLQHFHVDVGGVVAGLDLTGFHAEGGVEVHSLNSVGMRRSACLWAHGWAYIYVKISYLAGMVEMCCVKLATHSAVSTVVAV